MSAAKPIPIGNKGERRQEMANSFPREKKIVSRVSSSPVCAAGEVACYGAELRRRSDNFFNSFGNFCEELTKPRALSSDGTRKSNDGSPESKNGTRKSNEGSPDSEKLRIDAWMERRENRRHSSPTLALHGDKVGSAV